MKRQLFIATLLSLALLFAGCAQAPAAEATEPPAAEAVEVVDMMGRTVALDAPATRVVALSAADCETLYAIGAGDALVGRGEYCDYPAEALEKPAVQSGLETNIEQIIALKPQVLLMSAMAQTAEQVSLLEAAGIKCVVSDADDIEGVYAAISMIGEIMGRGEAAADVISEMREVFASVSHDAAQSERKTVYFEVSPLQYGLWTAGGGTFMNEIAELIGLENAFGDVTGWGEISEEQVIMRNPDYIVTIAMYGGEGPTPTDEILSRAGWESVTAVQNGAILHLQNDELSRPSPRLMDGAKLLYDFVCAASVQDDAA